MCARAPAQAPVGCFAPRPRRRDAVAAHVRNNLVRIPGRPLVQQLPFILRYFILVENDYVQPS